MAMSVIGSLLGQLPIFCAVIAGFVATAMIWNRHPPAAKLLLAASLLVTFELVIGLVVTTAIPLIASQRSMNTMNIGVLFAAIGLLRSLLLAIAWGLLLAAVMVAVRAIPEDVETH